MAKINVEFDTLEKTMNVTMDGKTIENAEGVSLYRGWSDDEKYGCSICVCSKDEASDVTTYTRVTASDSSEGKKITEGFETNDAIPGFKIVHEVKTPSSAKYNREQLVKSVASFFGEKSE